MFWTCAQLCDTSIMINMFLYMYKSADKILELHFVSVLGSSVLLHIFEVPFKAKINLWL